MKNKKSIPKLVLVMTMILCFGADDRQVTRGSMSGC